MDYLYQIRLIIHLKKILRDSFITVIIGLLQCDSRSLFTCRKDLKPSDSRLSLFRRKTLNKCPVDWDNSTVPEYEDNFWISCPKDSNGNDVFPKPDTFISVGLIFLSSILQRWGVYIFDMAATQLFQVTVPMNERNRVAAGQFRSGSLKT